MNHPTEKERAFLKLCYNRFDEIFTEVMSDDFKENKSTYRFSRIKNAFEVYSEMLNYEPFKLIIKYYKQSRPNMEGEIASDFFKFIRNVISHFPFFDNWDDVWINKSLVNWNRDGQTIDRFLEKYKGTDPVKYRFWEPSKKRMTYIEINFPIEYNAETRIKLNDFLSEINGIKFSLILMKEIIDTQIERKE